MSQIKSSFEVAEMNQTQEQSEEIKSFTYNLESFKFVDSTPLNNSVEAILYYIAGYIAKSLSKEKCDDCNTLISPSKVDMPLILEELSDDMGEKFIEAKEEFVASVSIGGLSQPSDYIYIASVHASCLYNFIFNDENLRKTLLCTHNPRKTFVESFMCMIKNDDNSASLLSIECKNGHKHKNHLHRVAFTIFNSSAKNYASEINDQARKKKATKDKSKRWKSARKIKKLQSN